MAIKVTEIELTDPYISFEGISSTEYTHIQCLVRVNNVPIGYCWFRLDLGLPVPDPATIRLEVVQQLQHSLFQTLTKNSLKNVLNSDNRSIMQDRDIIESKTLSYNSSESLNPSLLPTVTVTIVTRNRSESLERALHSLVKLDYPSDKLEVLIVDNAPSDETTKRVVEKFPKFRYVLEPRPGLEWGRNRAIVEAKGEIIAYTDDDVEVDSQWVMAIGRCFASNPEIMTVTGLVAPARRDNQFQNMFEEFGGFGKGFQRKYYNIGLQKSWPTFPLGAGMFGTGANMAFRKSVLQQLDGFDEALGAGSLAGGGGDLDMFYRVVRSGFLLIYEPEALLWHHHRSDYVGLKKQLQGGLFCLLTKIMWHDPKMRWKALRSGWRWFYGELLIKAVKTREPLQRSIRWARVWNAVRGPVKYFRSVRRRNQLIEQYGRLELKG